MKRRNKKREKKKEEKRKGECFKKLWENFRDFWAPRREREYNNIEKIRVDISSCRSLHVAWQHDRTNQSHLLPCSRIWNSENCIFFTVESSDWHRCSLPDPRHYYVLPFVFPSTYTRHTFSFPTFFSLSSSRIYCFNIRRLIRIYTQNSTCTINVQQFVYWYEESNAPL